MIDAKLIKKDFPIFNKLIDGKPLVYLDSTATALKPQCVIDAVNGYYSAYSANVFRGIYKISETATAAYEKSRKDVAEFIHAKHEKEIIFTRNASESLNLVLYSWARFQIKKGDEIVTTGIEHHSNFVPWQQLCHETGAHLKIWDLLPDYTPDYQGLEHVITKNTKLLAFTSMSNVLGTMIDVEKVAGIAKRINPSIIICVDAAQSVPHTRVDVSTWGADFVAFSGHKMLGPTGIGVLWGREELLESMHPFQYGGDMISEVHMDTTVFNELPHKFEAGTPHISGAIGLGAAVSYLKKLGMDAVREHEKSIVSYALKELKKIKGITVHGPEDAINKGGVCSFTIQGIHPHDVAQILDQDNVCIRVGYHCAQPLHEKYIHSPTARASFYVYTAKEDVDALVSGLHTVVSVFS